MNRKKTLLPFVFTCVFAGLSGVAFGVAIAIIARATFVSLDPAVMPVALYSLIGGIVFVLAALGCLLALRKGNKPVDPNAGCFLEPKTDLLSEEEFLLKGKENKTRGMGALTYAILSSLSEDERTFVSPATFLVATDKGDVKAKLEEVSRQALSSLSLDPTLPELRLTIGLEADPSPLEAETRLNHAKLAATYDSLSRLSGSLAAYDKAMEIDSYGLSLNLKEAVDEERLEIGYVPLLAKNNKTYAYMRSVRLFDPSRGLIEEEELRRLADNARQGEVLDEFALAKAFEDLSAFDAGRKKKLPMLVLPIGRSTFYRASFLQELRKTCAQLEVDVSRICLAFSGSSLEADEAYCASFAKKAHGVGIKVAVLGFSAKCPLTRVNELRPDVVSFAPSFFVQDPRLGKAKIEVLKNTALTIEAKEGNYDTIPDLYLEKEVTPSLAVERLQQEEEFSL